MFMSLVSNLLSAYFAFLLPCYSTYKALAHRPVSEPDLERLCMYWTVIGAFVAFQYTAEWLISWFPFYFEVKTLLLLFLALPQIQGSTFIYQRYMQPFFSQNEADLDAGIASFQNNIFGFVQARMATIIELVLGLVNKSAAARQSGAPGSAKQPAAGNAAGGLSMESAMGLWKSYGPAVMGGLARGGQPAATASSTSLQPNVAPSAERRASNSSFNASPAGTPQGYSTTPPPFPEPQHFA